MAAFPDKAIAGSQTSHQHRGESCPSAFVLNLLNNLAGAKLGSAIRTSFNKLKSVRVLRKV